MTTDVSDPSVSLGQVASLADVAATAGVSTSIASRIINADPTVSVRPETRERVLAAAKALQYRPNFLGRGLRSARSMTVALVVPGLAYPVNSEIIRGAHTAATAQGYACVVVDADDFFSPGATFKSLLLERRFDGVLLAGASDTAESRQLISGLREQRLHFVLVNRRMRGVEPYIILDDAAGMALAVEHLASLGHRRIALIGGPATADTAQRRFEGFRRGMRAAGLRVDSRLTVESPFDERSGFDAMSAFLRERKPPTAVAAWSLGVAIGASAAAREHGLVLPDELSVIAFHDAELATYLDPPLTTVQMALGQMGAEAFRLLFGLIEGGSAESVVIDTPPRLVIRGSTAPPAGP